MTAAITQAVLDELAERGYSRLSTRISRWISVRRRCIGDSSFVPSMWARHISRPWRC
ncbi:MAG: hypothetical protein ABW137_06055 [Mycobacterium sp.]